MEEHLTRYNRGQVLQTYNNFLGKKQNSYNETSKYKGTCIHYSLLQHGGFLQKRIEKHIQYV
jgi:hypothetical protein